MRGRIYGALKPVRRRQLGQLLARAAAWGLLVGSAGGVYLGVVRLMGRPVPPALAIAFLAGGPALGMLIGALRGRSFRGAAAAVDAHYDLKDRASTALDFLDRPEPTPLHTLQIADADAHLGRVSARAVAPFRMPKALGYAASLFLVAGALLVWPVAPGKRADARPAAADPAFVAEAEKIVEDLKAIEEIAKSERNADLEKLAKELIEKAEEMKQPGVDLKEALAKLSEMQAAMVAEQAKYNVGLVDGQLQSLGAAMQAAEATDAAGQALQEGKFDQAVKEFDKLDTPPVDKKQAKTLDEKLKDASKQMGEVGLGQMGEATAEMAEGAAQGDKGKFRKATKTLANLTKGHAGRRRIKQLLDMEIDSLDESKAGECKSEFAMRGKKPEKSTSPSTNWGATTSGNVLGDKTKLQANRKVEEITGNPGDGPSEMETTHSPEGKQRAARGYKESYDKYKKMSEDVLDTEPIPLGHRQAIRRYFELIRPSGESAANAQVKDAPAGGDGK